MSEDDNTRMMEHQIRSHQKFFENSKSKNKDRKVFFWFNISDVRNNKMFFTYFFCLRLILIFASFLLNILIILFEIFFLFDFLI